MNFVHDQQRNILVYPTKSPLLMTHVPEAREINGQYTALPHTLRNLQVLRWLNFPVPAVITDVNYDWPRRPGITPYQSQKLAANFMVLNRRCFNLSDMGCVDAETEYLSPTGWRRIDQYDGGLVTQWHPEGFVTLVAPEYVVKPCSWMWRFKTSRGIDQKLSPEHRVLYADMQGKLQMTEAGIVAIQQHHFAQGWPGRFITTFAGGGAGVDLNEAQIRVMVAVIADGSFPCKTARCVINIKKERKKKRLVELLNAAGIEFTRKELPYKSKVGHSLFSFIAPRREKEFGDFWWDCAQQQLRFVAAECVHWDGTTAKGNRGPLFCSMSKRSADFVQYSFSATGYTAGLNQAKSHKRTPELWVVTTRNKAALVKLSGVHSDGKKTDPVWIEPTTDGKKYCFTVPTSFLVLRRNGCIFVTGNSGKTLTSLWAADFLMRQHNDFATLIVAPLSTLESVWANAIFTNFLNARSVEILHGDANKRAALLSKSADFFVCNFDGVGIGAHTRNRMELAGFSKLLAENDRIKLVIIDEASAYKDAQTKRHRLARTIIGRREYLWMMTGSPTPNAPTDAYGLAKLMNNAFGKSFKTFQQESMMQVSQFKWAPRKDGYDKARDLLAPSIRIDIKEVWDAPPMTVQQRTVALTDVQKKALHELKRDLHVVLKTGKAISAANEAAARLKFLQISLGAVYDSEHLAHKVDAAPRVTELKNVLAEAGKTKALVFAPFTSVLNLLNKELDGWTREVVNGDTNPKERARIFSLFQQQSNPQLLIADARCMAHGLDLWMAQTVIWYGPVEGEIYQQANKRAHRPGQKYPVTIVQLVSTKLEAEIFRRLENNESQQGVLLQLISRGEL